MYEILLIGDSLTEWNFENGWGKQLKEWYNDKAEVFNCGHAGYTSKMIKENIEWITNKHKSPMMCTLLLGTNDCYFKGRYASPQEYKKNIVHIIQHLRSLNKYCVIVLVTPPICLINNKIMDYVIQAREIGREQCVPLVDLYKKSPFRIDCGDLSDGMHINEKGNKKLFENIKQTLLTTFPIICPDSL